MKKAKYKRQVALGYNSEGKRIRKWVYANTKADLEKNTRELLATYQCCDVPLDTTFDSYSQRWLNVYKSNKEGNTIAMYKTCLNLTDKIKDIAMVNVTITDLQELINDNWDHAETCKKLKMTLKAIFRKAMSEGLISKNPASELECPKVIQKEKRALSKAESEAIRALLKPDNTRLPDRNKVLLACLYYFGMRPEEVRGLMKSDFDFGKETVTVQRALAYVESKPVLKGTKTENKRILPIPTVAMPLLKKYVENLDKLYLFHSRDVALIPLSTYVRLWKNTLKQINITLGGDENIDLTNGLTPYTFRRNYATQLYYSNISIKKAAYFMGHTDTKMILSVYAQIDDEKENIEALKAIV